MGYKAVQSGIPLDDVERLTQLSGSLSPADLSDPSLRGDDAAKAASRVSVRGTTIHYIRAEAVKPII